MQQSTATKAVANDPADSDEEEELVVLENLHMSHLNYKYESSICSSDSEDVESLRLSPVPDDANSKLHSTFLKPY